MSGRFYVACIALGYAASLATTGLLTFPRATIEPSVLSRPDEVDRQLSSLRESDILVIGTSEVGLGAQASRLGEPRWNPNFFHILNEDAEFPHHCSTLCVRLFIPNLYYFCKAHLASLKGKHLLVSLNNYYLYSKWTANGRYFQDIDGTYGDRIFGPRVDALWEQMVGTPATPSESALAGRFKRSDLQLTDYPLDKEPTGSAAWFREIDTRLQTLLLRKFDLNELYVKRRLDYDVLEAEARRAVAADPETAVNPELNVRQKFGYDMPTLRNFAKTSWRFAEDNSYTLFLLALAELARQNGITLDIVFQPLNKIAEERIGMNLTEKVAYYSKLERLLTERGARVISLVDMPDQGMFTDLCHYNVLGSVLIARRVKQALLAHQAASKR